MFVSTNRPREVFTTLLASYSVSDVVELFRKWQAGERDAGDQVLRALFPSLFRFFRSKVHGDVDDLIQRTLLDCVESRETVRDAEQFRGFVFRIARNRLFDQLRRERTIGPHVDLSQMSLQELGASPSSVVAGRERKQLVAEALCHLPLDYQIALELSYWEGLKAPQVGQVLGLKASTVRTRLMRARDALKGQLQSMGVVFGAEEDPMIR